MTILHRYLTTGSKKPSYTIGLLPGFGIGTSVIPAAKVILQTLNRKKYKFIDLETLDIDSYNYAAIIPQETMNCLKSECDAALFGSLNSHQTHRLKHSAILHQMRKDLKLFANIRAVSQPALSPDHEVVDLVIVRELTECFYGKKESLSKLGDVASVERRISQQQAERVGMLAFDIALTRYKARMGKYHKSAFISPPKVTIVHKANQFPVSDGLFRDAIMALQSSSGSKLHSHLHSSTIQGKSEHHLDYRKILVEDQLVDSVAYRLFKEPELFDVLVAPNLYGDIIREAAAALVESMSLVPSASIGDNFVLGESVHANALESTPRFANPIASIRSAALVIEQLGELEDASKIHDAVNTTIGEGQVLTPDLGGKDTTNNVVETICKKMVV